MNSFLCAAQEGQQIRLGSFLVQSEHITRRNGGTGHRQEEGGEVRQAAQVRLCPRNRWLLPLEGQLFDLFEPSKWWLKIVCLGLGCGALMVSSVLRTPRSASLMPALLELRSSRISFCLVRRAITISTYRLMLPPACCISLFAFANCDEVMVFTYESTY